MSLDCKTCAGDGFNYETCPACRGNGGRGCRYCGWNRDVKIECADCHGTGLGQVEADEILLAELPSRVGNSASGASPPLVHDTDANSQGGPETMVRTNELTGCSVPSAAIPVAHLLGGAPVCSAVGAPNASGDGPHAPSFSPAAEQ